ncbi:MAG: hypothetical protein ACU0B5_01650 [Roseovarius sp.]
MLDWSAGNDTGPRPRRDAIWLGVVRGEVEEDPRYLHNRGEAEAALAALIEGARTAGRRLLIGVDFPFGFPAGFSAALTGHADPFASLGLAGGPDRGHADSEQSVRRGGPDQRALFRGGAVLVQRAEARYCWPAAQGYAHGAWNGRAARGGCARARCG